MSNAIELRCHCNAVDGFNINTETQAQTPLDIEKRSL